MRRKRCDITLKYDWLDMLDGSAMLDFKSDPALLRALEALSVFRTISVDSLLDGTQKNV